MKPSASSLSRTWRYGPWLVALGAAPLLYGGSHPQHLAILGALLGISYALLAPDMRGPKCSWRDALVGIVVCLAFLPLLPLPSGFVEMIAPARAEIARAVPVDGASPAFIPLTLSTTRLVQRLWELGLLAICFLIARHTGKDEGATRPLVATLSAGVILLCLSEAWRGLGDGPKVAAWLGNSGSQAGPFVNRNHFANWLVVASLFLAGAALRRKPAQAAALLAVSATGMVFAVMTGSRAGAGALVVGGATLLVLLLRQRRTETSRALALLFAAGLLAVISIGSAYVLERFMRAGGDVSYKSQIWLGALAIFKAHWAFGVGAGAFERAFDYYKTFGPELSFVHAENEIVQIFAEHGLVAASGALALLGGAVWRVGKEAVRQAGRRSASVITGAAAALAAFAFHAQFEFVLQIPATALLFAALFGWALGVCDRGAEPIVPPPSHPLRIGARWGLALVVMAVAGLQFVSWQRAQSLAPADLLGALRLWPWSPEIARALAAAENARLQARIAGDRAPNPQALAAVRKAVHHDPLNWRLRVEAFALRDAGGEPLETLVAEARRIMRANPLQHGLPLMFARRFASEDPDFAMECVRQAASSGQALREVLRLGWQLKGDTETLWSLVPPTDDGMQALGDFAALHNFLPMAERAYESISENVSRSARAENFLRARAPQRALALLMGDTPEESLVKARAHQQLGQHAAAIHAAESVWGGGPIPRAGGALSPELREAEENFALPPGARDLPRLTALAAKHPEDRRVAWIVMETLRELGRFEQASSRAIELAQRHLRARQ